MICISLGNLSFDEIIEAIRGDYIYEIRLDLCTLKKSEIKEVFSRGKQLIATYREGKYNDKERFLFLTNAIESGATYVDIELESSDEYKREITRVAMQNNCKIIISYHNFEKTPERRELKEIIKWSFESGAEISKISCIVNNEREISRILSLYDLDILSDKKIIAIGMGEKGKITRILAPILGAPFTYASFSKGKETAAGQIDVKKMEEIILRLSRV